MVHDLHSAIGKRERKKNTVYDVDQYYREVLQMPKRVNPNLPKPRKLPTMHDFQFYDKKRLHQLHEKEVVFYSKYQFQKMPEGKKPLNDEEEKEREELIKVVKKKI